MLLPTGVTSIDIDTQWSGRRCALYLPRRGTSENAWPTGRYLLTRSFRVIVFAAKVRSNNSYVGVEKGSLPCQINTAHIVSGHYDFSFSEALYLQRNVEKGLQHKRVQIVVVFFSHFQTSTFDSVAPVS